MRYMKYLGDYPNFWYLSPFYLGFFSFYIIQIMICLTFWGVTRLLILNWNLFSFLIIWPSALISNVWIYSLLCDQSWFVRELTWTLTITIILIRKHYDIFCSTTTNLSNIRENAILPGVLKVKSLWPKWLEQIWSKSKHNETYWVLGHCSLKGKEPSPCRCTYYFSCFLMNLLFFLCISC